MKSGGALAAKIIDIDFQQGCHGVDFHVEDDEINGNKEVPDFNRNVLCNSYGVTDCLVR